MTALSGFSLSSVILCLLLFASAQSLGDFGGTYWENLLETPIDLREPRTFPQSELLVVRQWGYHELNTTKGIVPINNWEVYTEQWWYETRYVNATCPEIPAGIAATVDWALMCLCLFGNPEKLPKTIYVHTLMLPHFAESTLAFMDHNARFILISSGMDLTFPYGTGEIRSGYRNRLRGFGGANGGINWNTIINDPRVLHWYAENHDISHPKLSTLPTGFTFDLLNTVDQNYISHTYENMENIKMPLLQRPLKVLTSDRLRDRTGQWAARYNAEQMCLNVTWCYVPEENLVAGQGIAHAQFIKLLHQHSFVSCVHGGGMDPSPKAFEAIHEGTIPIIARSTVADAYEHLPVMWVDDWESFFRDPNAESLLMQWRNKLAPYYEPNSAMRRATLEKLHTSYWRELMDKKYRKLMGLNDKSKANDGLRRMFSLDASANATYTGLKEEFKELKKLRKRL